MGAKRVFILGAGFSAQAGMPLATELTKLVLADFDVPGGETLHEWLKDLGNRIEWLNNSSGQSSPSVNVEELFDLARYDILVYRMRSVASPPDRSALYAQSAQRMKDALGQMEKHLWNAIVDGQQRVAGNLGGIDSFSQQLCSDDTVVTFNYDTLLEDSLSRHSMHCHYGFRGENGEGVPILKMHGSVNWLKVPDGASMTDDGRYRVLVPGRAEHESASSPAKSATAYRLLCHRECSPAKLCADTRFRSEPGDDQRALSGLGSHKPLDQLPGSWEVWARAIRSLKGADEIYVVGFSLSPFDTMARLHFAGAMCERAKKQSMPKRVVLIDPHACELEARFRSVFGSSPIETVQKRAEDVDWNGLFVE